MEEEPKNEKSDESWPIPLWIGVALSVSWLFILVLYSVSQYSTNETQWHRFWHDEPANFGNALAGVFAPLAFLWLVVATFLQKEELIAQRRELRQSRKALELQAQELKNSVEQFTKQTTIAMLSHEEQQNVATQNQIADQIKNLARFCVDRLSHTVYFDVIIPNTEKRPQNVLVQPYEIEHLEKLKIGGENEKLIMQFVAYFQRFKRTLHSQQSTVNKLIRSESVALLKDAKSRANEILVLAENVKNSSAVTKVIDSNLEALPAAIDDLLLGFEQLPTE